MKCIINAGNSGAGLWPISGNSYPESLFQLFENGAVLQNVYKYALSLTDEKNIAVAANAGRLNMIKKSLAKVSKNPRIIIEPMNKNSAASAACALYYMQGKRDETAVLLPADFTLKSPKLLKEAAEYAIIAAKKGYIAVIGAKYSNYKDSRFFIQAGKPKKNITPALKFFSDSSVQDASVLAGQPDIYFNTGIYTAKISVLLEEIRKYSPDSEQGFSKDMFNENNSVNYEYYEKLPDVSLEEAVIAKSDKLAFSELKTKMNSFNSWQSVYTASEKDSSGCLKGGSVYLDRVSDSLVYSSKGLTAVSQQKNTAVINTEDALLVYSMDRASDAEKLIAGLKSGSDNQACSSKTVVRPWGVYTFLDRGRGWLTKMITVYPGHKLARQSHNYRSEHWVVLEGEAAASLENEVYTLKKGTSINIPVKAEHSLRCVSDIPLKILEVQKGEYIGEDDIIRYEEESSNAE